MNDLILHIFSNFNRTATPATLGFSAFVLLVTVLILYYSHKTDPETYKKYAIIVLAVAIFEIFTGPMWINEHLGNYGYYYRDTSWILTLGWSTTVFGVVTIIDGLLPKWPETKRFPLYLILILIIIIPIESAIVAIGIRSYAPEVMAIIANHSMPFFNIPWDGLYYIPVFITLIITFYKYISIIVFKKVTVPIKKLALRQSFFILFAGVLLFEIMIEPMVINQHFPAWSYIYRDISILMSMIWIVVILISEKIANRLFVQHSQLHQFGAQLLITAAVLIPIEAWFIANGYRIYGSSAQNDFIGLTIPIFNVPIEVVVGATLYLGLVICFSRYWNILIFNKQLK